MAALEKIAEQRVLARLQQPDTHLVRRGLQRWNWVTGSLECISGRGVTNSTVTRLLAQGLLVLSDDMNSAALKQSTVSQETKEAP